MKQKTNIKLLLFCSFLFFLMFSCSNNNQLQNGDFLFIAEDSGDLSGAINRVTQTEQKTAYSHIAIIEIKSDTVWVWDASPKRGVGKLALKDFIDEQKGEIHHYRIKKEYSKSLDNIWRIALQMSGKPYNFSYVLNDSSYYCSDFIYRLFAKDSIFELNPMTFIDPQTEKPDSGWIKYYANLNMDIPEGEPGCNPNGLADCNKLEYIGIFNPKN